MKLKFVKFLLSLCVFGLIFSSCRSDDPIVQRNRAVNSLYKKGKVKIAIANSFENNPTQEYDAILLAQEEINNSEDYNFDIEIFKFDDGTKIEEGMKTAYQIVNDSEICAVIGHGYSDISMPVSLIYQYYGVLMFCHISTADKLTAGNNNLLFRNVQKNSAFGEKAAKICEQQGLKNVIIYYEDVANCENLANAFELNCHYNNPSIVTRNSFDITVDNYEFRRICNYWKSNFSFDGIFLAANMPFIVDIVKIIRENGINCKIIGADSFDDPLFEKELSSSENGKIFAISNFDNKSKNPEYIEFAQKFREKYGSEPDQEALQGYDALKVIAEAIKIADSAKPADIAKTLRSTEWNQAAGPYSFDKNGDIENRDLVLKIFKDGEFVSK